MMTRAIRATGALAVRHPWLTVVGLAVMLSLGGFAVAVSGLMPLRASTGHWAVTRWLLVFSKERSIVTHSALIDAPPLDGRARLVRGAAHYDRGCSPCHGSVLGRIPRVAEAMLPPPPYLPPRVSRWSPAQLFYLVKHGLKFTGMPAWPAAGRDDEVWDVVAFLRALPGMGADDYRRLASAAAAAGNAQDDLRALGDTEPVDREAPDVIRDSCAQCHGMDGAGRDDAFPVLAAQRAEYMENALRAYRDRRRHSGVMGAVAANLSDAEAAAAARYYAGLSRIDKRVSPSAASIERGREIAAHGLQARKVPACIECHGPSAVPKNPAYPILAGQPAAYLRLQLLLLQQGARGGSEYVHLMRSFVGRLHAEEIAALAEYFSSIAPVMPPPLARRAEEQP
jgi:cytochrome c553